VLRPASVSKANLFETFAVLVEVLFPTLAKGVIIRRPKMLAVAERFDLDRRASAACNVFATNIPPVRWFSASRDARWP